MIQRVQVDTNINNNKLQARSIDFFFQRSSCVSVGRQLNQNAAKNFLSCWILVCNLTMVLVVISDRY